MLFVGIHGHGNQCLEYEVAFIALNVLFYLCVLESIGLRRPYTCEYESHARYRLR
jgi:hypothetical protein